VTARFAAEVCVPVTVEFEDVDSFRIAHHTKLIAYLERARLRLLAAHGVDLGGAGGVPVMYELEVKFRRPARLLDALEVRATAREVDAYRVALSYRVRRGSETILRARSVVAFADAATGALAPVPEALAAALEGSREPGGCTSGGPGGEG
jgi:acyl-CoA thioester hydrolase